ncbi:MAG: TerB family tellurite resistance protein [Gammaproteobacteria bacterium]|nr:TerB family tellurite resistance protein [Gammaproteobacteria bacterium]MDH4256257.1 TerB family tellurite resistance protein [Gammaproteobacteria bacterium]MDH5310630.1 TerB family tellurite resistance protein [Gammaproteobacteria bacterium]
MFKRFLDQVTIALAKPDDNGAAPERVSAIRVSTAVLLIEVARADHDFGEDEFDRLLRLLQRHFRFSAEEATALANQANDTAEEAVSLHDFTQLLHDNLSEDEKSDIVSMLWKVAYADGRLHRYEDSLILKISDLLHVNRARVMRLKHDAEQTVPR